MEYTPELTLSDERARLMSRINTRTEIEDLMNAEWNETDKDILRRTVIELDSLVADSVNAVNQLEKHLGLPLTTV